MLLSTGWYAAHTGEYSQYHIDVTDIRQLEVTEKEKALDEKRAEMSHQVIQTDEWPLFDVRITK